MKNNLLYGKADKICIILFIPYIIFLKFYRLRWLFKLNLHPSLQHCTDEAQKAETVLSAVIIFFPKKNITADSTVTFIYKLQIYLPCQLQEALATDRVNILF